MGTIQDTDYLLINRDNIDYKITSSDFKDYLDQFLPPEAVPPDTGITVGDWQFYFSTSKPVAMSSSTCISKDLNPFKNWATYGVTFNASNNEMKFYHNGNLAGSEIMSNTPNNIIGNYLTIFALDPTNGEWRSGFHGWARSYRLYNKVLTESELKSNYSQDMDFKSDYQQPNTPGAIVILDARKSNMNIDLTKNRAYIENLANGSMDEFWWTDGRQGPDDNGISNPTEFLEYSQQYGIWKFNENRPIQTSYDQGYVASNDTPDLDANGSMEFAFVPLSMGHQNSTFMASCPRAGSSTLKLQFSYNNCAPTVYP